MPSVKKVVKPPWRGVFTLYILYMTLQDMRFKDFVASLFQGPVDVIDRAALKPHLRAPSARDAVYAF